MMTPWVRLVMIVTVVVSLAVELQLLPFNPNYLALIPALVTRYPWMPITYMLIHGGLLHLFFNMIGLFFFGPRLEYRLGSTHFVGLYLVSGLFGALLSIVNPLGSRSVAIVGASGAVFGILFAFARYWPRERIMIWAILPVEARTLVIVLAAISIVLGMAGTGRIAHFAHLGGFVGGYLYLKVMEAMSPARRFRRQASGLKGSSPTSTDMERWSAIRLEGLHEINVQEVQRLLEKARTTGPTSLTPDERAYLDRMSS
jgi:membrane associated rhomboid family serine protease